MIQPTRTKSPLKVALWVTFAALALLIGPAGAHAESAPFKPESLQTFERQLAAGEVAHAKFNKRVRSLRVTLKNNQDVLVHYAAGGSPALEQKLRAKGVTFTILSKKAAEKEAKKAKVKHKLRYIVGGILVVVVIVVGAVLLIDRRRKRAAE